MPWVNWALMIGVLILVFAFRSSTALAFAFGMAVTATITITTVLFFAIVRYQWRQPLWLVLLGGGVFLLLEGLFLAANLTKLVHGAWLPLTIGVVVFTVMTTWQKGRILVTQLRERDEGSLRVFVDQLHERRPPLHRVPGTAVFLNRGKVSTPLAMRANVEHNRILHEHVVILSVETLPVPHVPDADRLVLDDLGYSDDGITHITARFGYMDEPDVPACPRPCPRGRSGEPARGGRGVLLPVHDRADRRRCPDHDALAEEPLRRHRRHHRRCSRLLPPATGAHRHHRITHQRLNRRLSRRRRSPSAASMLRRTACVDRRQKRAGAIGWARSLSSLVDASLEQRS